VARACCPAHTLGGYWVTVERVEAEWAEQLRDLSRKPWRGDVALRELLGGEPARPAG
jgi:hypothetical protein